MLPAKWAIRPPCTNIDVTTFSHRERTPAPDRRRHDRSTSHVLLGSSRQRPGAGRSDGVEPTMIAIVTTGGRVREGMTSRRGIIEWLPTGSHCSMLEGGPIMASPLTLCAADSCDTEIAAKALICYKLRDAPPPTPKWRRPRVRAGFPPAPPWPSPWPPRRPPWVCPKLPTAARCMRAGRAWRHSPPARWRSGGAVARRHGDLGWRRLAPAMISISAMIHAPMSEPRLEVNDGLGRRVDPDRQSPAAVRLAAAPRATSGWWAATCRARTRRNRQAEDGHLDAARQAAPATARSSTAKPVTEHRLTHGDRVQFGRTGGAEVVFLTGEASLSASGTDRSAGHRRRRHPPDGDAARGAARARLGARARRSAGMLVLDAAIGVTGAERGFIMLAPSARADGAELDLKLARSQVAASRCPATGFDTSPQDPRRRVRHR